MASVVENFKDQVSSASSGEMSKDMENLKSSFSRLRNDVVELLTQALGAGKTGAGIARDGTSQAVDSLKSRFSDLKDRGSEGVATVEHQIEENPLASALIAFGIGFVLAKILTRR